MAIVMANAANMAYLKAIKKTRNKDYLAQNHPFWMQYFADNLPERIAPPMKLKETRLHRKRRILAHSKSLYNRFAWFIYSKMISRNWFDAFILINILAIGAVTGLDLESANEEYDANRARLIEVVSWTTSAVFAVEAALKIISEGPEPSRYFTDEENGKFNTLDFFIVTTGYALIGVESGSAVGVLRMLRLVRLLTFIKGVPQLRAIITGLVKGVSSVSFIVLLLVLIIYLFGIVGVLFFGENDNAHFGTVALAMISLFQVSTLASWTSVAYTSWYGCGDYNGDPYTTVMNSDDDAPSYIKTLSGSQIGFQCHDKIAQPAATFLFFSFFIVITSWVVMSLFIGVISMEMFQAFNDLREKEKESLYRSKLEENQEICLDDNESDIFDDDDQAPRPKESDQTTLKEQIDFALDEEGHDYIPASLLELRMIQLQQLCLYIRDHYLFETVIIVSIVTVGFMLGVDSDYLQICERRNFKLNARLNDDHSGVNECQSLEVAVIINNIALGVFAFEAAVKIIAEGTKPMRYFNDLHNGSWNRLDFFIVVIGFVEISGVGFLDFFPVVLLRLLRLLRVLRLTKAFPGLRSIVDALLSGLTSVGWICILLVVFNYIAGCFCILFFGKNDPFHFGSVSRAMFTVLRMETLDSWDQVFKIAFYGCGSYPNGYVLVNSNSDTLQCTNNQGFGVFGAMFMYTIVLFGAYILPTVLVGIVSINFNIATHRTAAIKKMQEEMVSIEAVAKKYDPNYFNTTRLMAIRKVFETMDADGEFTLDLNELTPFYHFVFDFMFHVALEESQIEALFHLMDCDGDSELGFEEFLLFILVVKKLHDKCKADPDYKEVAFPPDQVVHVDRAGGDDTWKRAMRKMDGEAIHKAWGRILDANHFEGDGIELQIRAMFDNFDSDGSGSLDVEELSVGLKSIGVLINTRQLTLMTKGMDKEGTGNITAEEFCKELQRRRLEKLKEFEELARQDAQNTLSKLSRQQSANSLTSTDNKSNGYSGLMPKKPIERDMDTPFMKAQIEKLPTNHFNATLARIEDQKQYQGGMGNIEQKLFNEDASKTIDELMHEVSHDMITRWMIDAQKTKINAKRIEPALIPKRYINDARYEVVSKLLSDRIYLAFEDYRTESSIDIDPFRQPLSLSSTSSAVAVSSQSISASNPMSSFIRDPSSHFTNTRRPVTPPGPAPPLAFQTI